MKQSSILAQVTRATTTLILCLITMLAFFPGCGGGTFGTGLIGPGPSSGFGGTPHRGTAMPVPAYTTVQITVHNASGKPLKDVTVVVETNQTTDTTAITDDSGLATAEVILDEGEPLIFRFFRNGKPINSRVIKKWRKEGEVVDLTFRMDESGRIR